MLTNDWPKDTAHTASSHNETLPEDRASQSLMRTVDHLKSTTTNMRGFADSVDHLLNALEEFYPFIDKFLIQTQSLRSNIAIQPPPMNRPCRKRR